LDDLEYILLHEEVNRLCLRVL